MLINCAEAASCSRANGPGARAVLWVQGCSLRCPGCHNPHTWTTRPRFVFTVDSAIAWYEAKARAGALRGLTLSGGEPFEQAQALAELCRRVRAGGADVVTFSGFTRAEIDGGVRPHASALLRETDLLVDGRYRADAPTALPLRGSANQRLHFLSTRIRPDEIDGLPRGEWVGNAAGSRVSGFAVDTLLGALRAAGARARGVAP
jgi:anaerobic ribonucleoside-triphosphate reductase activating protein